MCRIAVIIDDMFEDSEYTVPAKAFKAAGHEVVNVGLETGKKVKGKKEGTVICIDLALSDVSPAEFDALLIPGGYSPDKLRSHGEAVDFVKAFMDNDKPVFSICHGPQILITANSLSGRKVTCCKSLIQDVRNAGAEYINIEVLVDGNLVTSRQPSDLPAFIKESLEKLSIWKLPYCDSSGTAEHARIYEDDMPCREQDE